MEVFSNQEQLRLFLQSILLGVGLGAVYDLLRAPRRVFRFGWAATAVCDALFWLVLLAALFEFNLLFAAGQNRYFVLAGAAGGAVLYFQRCGACRAGGNIGGDRAIDSRSLLAGAHHPAALAAKRAGGENPIFCKKVCKTLFHFSRERYKIKFGSV